MSEPDSGSGTMATVCPLESDLLASSKKIFPVTPRARFLNMKLLGNSTSGQRQPIIFTLRVRFFDASANPDLSLTFSCLAAPKKNAEAFFFNGVPSWNDAHYLILSLLLVKRPQACAGCGCCGLCVLPLCDWRTYSVAYASGPLPFSVRQLP